MLSVWLLIHEQQVAQSFYWLFWGGHQMGERMSEAQFWRTLKKRLPSSAHFERIENLVAIGTPDVNFCWDGIEGWIELKFVPKWPKYKGKIITKKLWKPEQRIWALKRIRSGGKSFLFIQIEKDYLLFNSKIAEMDLEVISIEGLFEIALSHWHGSINIEEFKNALQKGIL